MLLTSLWIVDIGLFVMIIVFSLYKYSTRKFDYWKKRDVPYDKPVPFFGNFKNVLLLKTTVGEWLQKSYEKEYDKPYFGVFIFDEPHLILKCPKLVKQIMIRDFSNFTDRTVAYPDHDKVLSNFLFFMPNPQWKGTRSQLSPTFTSGKLKGMFPIITNVAEDLQKYLSNNQGVLDAKETVAKYSTDVIAKCFFGINAHCFDDENAMFRVLGRAMFDFRLRTAFSQSAYFSMQNFVKWFRINFFEAWIIDYFTDSFRKAFDARAKSQQRYNDFIDILKDLKTKGEQEGVFEQEQLGGASMQFFAAGFETTSSAISYTLYELCMNENIQNKLRNEILDHIKDNDGITYDSVLNLSYLDMCVKETLRKYPVIPFLDRKCLNDYKIPGTDLLIEKGIPVYIPLFALHYDSKYFPEPNRYNPERFLNTNFNSDGLVYIPFGDGPRSCIGERFGLLSTKLGLIYILTKFEVKPSEQTPKYIEFEPRSLVLQSKLGLMMKFVELPSA